MPTLGVAGPSRARDSLSRALVHAGHCAAWVCLRHRSRSSGPSAPSIGGDAAGWRSLGGALGARWAIVLVLVARHPTVTLTLVYLVVGTGTVLALTVLRDGSLPTASRPPTGTWILALPRVVLLPASSAVPVRVRVLGITWGGTRLRPRRGRHVPGERRARRGGEWGAQHRGGHGVRHPRRGGPTTGSPPSGSRREAGLHTRASSPVSSHPPRVRTPRDRAPARYGPRPLVAIAAAGSGRVDGRLRVPASGRTSGSSWAATGLRPRPAVPADARRGPPSGRGVTSRGIRRRDADARPPSPPPRTRASTCGSRATSR